ncbi:MAG: histidine kinase [Flavobacteriales bacterium]|nr:histidine kinase [Flavobacteriales bacterium]
MKKSTYIAASFILFTLQLFSQQTDTVATSISKRANTDAKIFAWINAANTISQEAPKRAFDYVQNAIELALILDNKRGEAYCYNTLGALNYSISRYDASIKSYEKALTLFNGLENEKGYYNSIKYIGAAYEGDAKLKKAESFYKKFQVLAIENKNKDDEIYAINALGRLYYQQENYTQSKVAYDTILVLEQTRNNPKGIIDATNNLGDVYEAIDDSSGAFQMYNQSLQLANDIGDEDRVNSYYSNSNKFYGKRGNTKQQIQVQQEAIEFNSSKGNKKALTDNYNSIAALSLKEEKPQEAIKYLKQNIVLMDELGTLESKEEALGLITEAYEQIGDYESALKSYQKLVKIQEANTKEKNKHIQLASTLSNELDEKDKRIELLQSNIQLSKDNMFLLENKKGEELKKQRIVIYALAGGFFVLLLAALLIIRSNRAKRKANAMLELKSLRTQMNPHFIFNSLNSVNSFISKNDDRSANKYLSQFSRLMRMVLENSKYDFVSLDSEIEILKLYLELEHLRFQDKFDYDFTIEDDIKKDEIEIPPMLIQPFIENSVWHGLRYLEEKGKLLVSVQKQKGKLLWTIEDNGIGREKSVELKTKNQQIGKSTGMKNIDNRLRILNKMNNTKMEFRVMDLNNGTTGTKVEISIPYQSIS